MTLFVAGLLNDMCQLVREQFLPGDAPRRKMSGLKHKLMTHGIGDSIHFACRRNGSFISVHTHPAEVVSKTRLKEGARLFVQGLAWRSEHLMDEGRSSPWPSAG
jgi:hypothetical protein